MVLHALGVPQVLAMPPRKRRLVWVGSLVVMEPVTMIGPLPPQVGLGCGPTVTVRVEVAAPAVAVRVVVAVPGPAVEVAVAVAPHGGKVKPNCSPGVIGGLAVLHLYWVKLVVFCSTP